MDFIVADFESRREAFGSFLEYCDICRNDPDQVVSKSGFYEALIESIETRLEYGSAYYFVVLGDLMKRQGFEVNWSGREQ